jgi:hypothetical protein
MKSQITKLLDNQDNAEIIRDLIAVILKTEFLTQKKLADNAPHIKDKKDFDIKVFIENSRPWELTGDSKETNPFPLVNVCLQETIEDVSNPGATVGKVKYTGTFCIDCYGCGNYQPEDKKEYIPDDSLSTKRAWQTARITRNILMSAFYTYLGLQGTVRRRRIEKISTIIPPVADSAISITGCRIIFKVEFHEISPEGDTVELETVSFLSKNEGEVVLIDILANTNEGDK